jgi:hypothetical protein
VTVVGALPEYALVRQVQGGPFGWVPRSSLAQLALARASSQEGGQVGPVASSQDYWLYIAGYLIYFVLILAIPGSRYYLLEKNLAFGRYAFFILKQVFNPYFLLCVAILTGVIIGSYFLISRGTDWLDYLVHQKLNELPLLGKLALFAVLAAIVIGLLYVLGFLLVIFGVLYVVLLVLDLLIDLAVMLVTAVVLIFLPGFILMMMQLVHYLFVRHPAEPVVREAMRRNKVDLNDAGRVASKMHDLSFVFKSPWSFLRHNSYLWSLDRMKKMIDEETAVMDKFEHYATRRRRFERNKVRV